MNRKVLLAGLILVAIALVVRWQGIPIIGSSPSRDAATADRAATVPAIRGKPATNFELVDFDGKPIRRADFQDKVLLVNFWATWCAPCIIEIPWFIEFQKQYGPSGFEVIGISMDDELNQQVKDFVKEHEMNYTVVMGDMEVAEAFGGIIGLPTTFLIDRKGNYYSMHRGLVGKDIVEEELMELLGPPAPAQAGTAPVAAAPPAGT
ncbi:MAG: TlpA family protein disulfide reductase [Acidobacteria bacterium]|nr:TlpA family protein disulfide reductase [Acidobacteriota bacterium]